ncbi:MAG: cytochrome P450 [Actinomycetia bacterium]|nr:cytochrome P450 [Actinomycetes bacterium]
MSELMQAPTVDRDTTPAPPTAKLPPLIGLPKVIQGLGFTVARRRMVANLARRHGKAFTLNIPVYGRTVMIADAQLARQLFTASSDDVGNIQPNLSRILGRGSVFALDGSEHRRRRRLLAPPFHGKSMARYEQIIEEETLRETANWVDGEEFLTVEPMMRITLNVILRAVFGADGEELDALRRHLPRYVALGSRLASLPAPSRTYGRYTPWGRLAEARREYDRLVNKLIDDAKADPNLGDRTDVLALLMRSTYQDGSAMSRAELGDELLTLLGAGHETTANTLAWVFERLSRHPEVLSAVAEEADTDGNELRQATILEVQRSRPTIEFAGRHVYAPALELGEWVIPQGFSVIVSIAVMHDDPDAFENPERFDPQRFVGAKPSASWVPFGGGARRCVGAAFANMEMDVVLRTILRHFTVETTSAPDEKFHFRGVAYTPKDGGRIVVRRRAAA